MLLNPWRCSNATCWYKGDGCWLVEPFVGPSVLEAAVFEGCGDGVQGLWAFSLMGWEFVCGGMDYIMGSWSWCIWIRLQELSIWVNSIYFFILQRFSTSKSTAVRDLKVLERGYWKSIKANCFQHDYRPAMGINTAVSKNARTQQNLRISAKQFSRALHILVRGGRQLGGGAGGGWDYEIPKRFRKERNRRTMIL